MGSNLVVPGQKPVVDGRVSSSLSNPEETARDEVRHAAALLLAKGYSAKAVAKGLQEDLVPGTSHKRGDKLHRVAYSKLRRWMREDSKFRDLIYECAVKELDLKTPLIFKGVAKSAMRGRVDAARLALEVTGRHTPNHETVVANVTVQIANIPRPK